MERLARSLEEQMKRAYWDSIEATLSDKENIDVEWLSRLYQEIPDRIIRWIKKDSDFSKEVRASFDKDLFVQMIKNDAFHGIDLLALVENTYSFIGQIQSAARDKREWLETELEGGTWKAVKRLRGGAVSKHANIKDMDGHVVVSKGWTLDGHVVVSKTIKP